MLIIQSITKILCVWGLAGGCVLMAQSLAPKGLTQDLGGSPSNRASNLRSGIGESVESASDSAVSAGVSASVEPEISATLGLPQYTGGVQGRRSFERSMSSAELGSLENQNVFTLGPLKNQNVAGGLSVGSRINRQQWHGIKMGGAGNSPELPEGSLPQAFQRAGNVSRTCGATFHLQSCDLRSGETTGKTAYKKNARTEEAAQTGETTYFGDFQDSTRGVALASPPDPGTEGSLTWNPSFAPGIDDLSQEEFLHPTLHVSGRRGARGRKIRGLVGAKDLRRSVRAPVRSSDPLNPQIGGASRNDLNPRVSDEPALSSDPLAALNQQLNPNNSQ